MAFHSVDPVVQEKLRLNIRVLLVHLFVAIFTAATMAAPY